MRHHGRIYRPFDRESPLYALAYLVVAVITAILATRAWQALPDEPARQSFLALGWTVSLTYVSFALSLIPALSWLRVAYIAFGSTVPAMALWTIDRAFEAEDGSEPDGVPRTLVSRVVWATVIVVPIGIIAHIATVSTPAESTVPSLLLGVFVFSTFAIVFWRLWRAYASTPVRVERTRRAYLALVLFGAAIFTLAEQLARTFQDTPIQSVAALQGPAPPMSVVLTGLSIYLLYHTVTWSRLLDLHELFSHVARIGTFAILLVVVDGVAVLWVDDQDPTHAVFQLFFASLMFLAAYDPLREPVMWASNRIFNRSGQQLASALGELRVLLPAQTSEDRLIELLLTHLASSGRCPVCRVYLWDHPRGAYVVVGTRSPEDQPPLQAVAASPFTDAFRDGLSFYARPVLQRRRSSAGELLELMDTMHADLVLPLSRAGLVLGWITLRDEAWTDGYSQEEIGRLVQIAELASVALSNILDFKALEEEHRLTALGAMAAGLAHEIRNPLAGVKGATQYLQDEALADDAKDMLHVIIDEVDRLDTVVSQFLDYARPFELHREAEQLNALVTHVLTLLRAEGVGPGVELVEALGGDLPAISADGARIQQVLFNLLKNGLQAMSPDGGTLTVTTRRGYLRSGHRSVEVVIRDTGQGIGPEDQQKLFVPFFTTKRDGTGLGLAICQRIVQAHEGELDLRSELGIGSTFVVRLPIVAATTSDGAERPVVTT